MSWWLFLLLMLFVFYAGLRVGGTLVKDYYEQQLKEIDELINKKIDEYAIPKSSKQADNSESMD